MELHPKLARLEAGGGGGGKKNLQIEAPDSPRLHESRDCTEIAREMAETRPGHDGDRPRLWARFAPEGRESSSRARAVNRPSASAWRPSARRCASSSTRRRSSGCRLLRGPMQQQRRREQHRPPSGGRPAGALSGGGSLSLCGVTTLRHRPRSHPAACASLCSTPHKRSAHVHRGCLSAPLLYTLRRGVLNRLNF